MEMTSQTIEGTRAIARVASSAGDTGSPEKEMPMAPTNPKFTTVTKNNSANAELSELRAEIARLNAELEAAKKNARKPRAPKPEIRYSVNAKGAFVAVKVGKRAVRFTREELETVFSKQNEIAELLTTEPPAFVAKAKKAAKKPAKAA
jgi:hypothetical protein